jgi:hypothetical protein
MSEISKQHEEAIEALREVLKNKHPYLLDILTEIGKTPNGLVTLQLRVYNGSVTDCVFTDVVRKVYNTKPPTKTT